MNLQERKKKIEETLKQVNDNLATINEKGRELYDIRQQLIGQLGLITAMEKENKEAEKKEDKK